MADHKDVSVERVAWIAVLLSRDLLAARKRDGSCPLCGTISPDCEHVNEARYLMAHVRVHPHEGAHINIAKPEADCG